MRNLRRTKVSQGVIHMTKTCTCAYTKREVITSIRLNYFKHGIFWLYLLFFLLALLLYAPTACTEGTLQPPLPLCPKHGSVQGTNPTMLPWCCYPRAMALERTSRQQESHRQNLGILLSAPQSVGELQVWQADDCSFTQLCKVQFL